MTDAEAEEEQQKCTVSPPHQVKVSHLGNLLSQKGGATGAVNGLFYQKQGRGETQRAVRSKMRSIQHVKCFSEGSVDILGELVVMSVIRQVRLSAAMVQ